MRRDRQSRHHVSDQHANAQLELRAGSGRTGGAQRLLCTTAPPPPLLHGDVRRVNNETGRSGGDQKKSRVVEKATLIPDSVLRALSHGTKVAKKSEIDHWVPSPNGKLEESECRPLDPHSPRNAGKPDHLLMPPGDKKTNRDLARSTTIRQTLVETKTICSQNEDNWTSAAVRRAVALRSRTPGGLSSHQRGASSSSARQRAGMSHAGGRPAWSGPPVRPRQSFQAALRAEAHLLPRLAENDLKVADRGPFVHGWPTDLA